MSDNWIITYTKKLKSQFSKHNIQYTATDVQNLLFNAFMEYYKSSDIESKNCPLIEYVIKNNECTLSISKKIKGNTILANDRRVNESLQLIKNTLKWVKEINKKVPNTSMFFWISDRIPWEFSEYLDKIPIYIYATPKDLNVPIFPDNTFYCLTMQKKFRGECYDWDKIKKLFLKTNKEIKDKARLIYFKGTDTTKNRYYIRGLLERYAKNKKSMVIKLDGWINYEPVTTNSKYLFLLNLPGHYPWSNRFKYLFLTNSVIININIRTIPYDETGYKDDNWISFIDLLMKPKQDYINIPYDYYTYNGTDTNISKKVYDLNIKTIDKIILKLEYIYKSYDKEKNKYDNMIKSYSSKINTLTNDVIYKYIYELIKINASIISN